MAESVGLGNLIDRGSVASRWGLAANWADSGRDWDGLSDNDWSLAFWVGWAVGDGLGAARRRVGDGIVDGGRGVALWWAVARVPLPVGLVVRSFASLGNAGAHGAVAAKIGLRGNAIGCEARAPAAGRWGCRGVCAGTGWVDTVAGAASRVWNAREPRGRDWVRDRGRRAVGWDARA